jgi:CheY-like chemotaxis protein
VLGLPTAVGRTAAYRSLALAAGGFLLSIGLGTLGALWVARGINGPIRQLGEAAEALGRGGPPLPSGTSIQEIRAVSEALGAAARAITKGEAERDDLLRKERHAREAAEAADRAKDEFLAILSHELRTPRNAVYGWARLMQSGRLDDTALCTHARDAIVRNAEVQVQLIDDLLDLSRITSGKMRLDARRIDLAPVVHEALDAEPPSVELHGGTVGAQSAGQDAGATFIVTLPVVPPAAAGEVVPPPPPRVLDEALASSRSLLDGWRVLVVDDEPDALALAQASLETAGASVRGCLSVGAALAELKQWRPDVLVSDIEMPGEDGYSLMCKVRALAPSEGGDTPAVALTAYGRVRDRLRALDAGFTVHLPKPVDPIELASVVASVAAQPRAIRIRQEPY